MRVPGPSTHTTTYSSEVDMLSIIARYPALAAHWRWQLGSALPLLLHRLPLLHMTSLVCGPRRASSQTPRSHTFDVASSTTTPWHCSSCSATSKPVMPKPHTPTVMRRGSNPTHPLLALGLALGWLGSPVLGPASRSLMCGRRPSRSQANCVLQGYVMQRSGQAITMRYNH